MFTTIACTKGSGVGASASSTISASDVASAGVVPHCKGGDTPSPSAVNRVGMREPGRNAEDETLSGAHSCSRLTD